jgi:CheY-like chemotaxis protein
LSANDILLVSQNKLTTQTIIQLLRGLGLWGVQVSTDPFDAWRRLVHGDVDTLMVSDDMQPLAATEFVRWVRHDKRLASRKCHILFIAKDAKAGPGQAKACGANRAASLPLSIADFVTAHAELKADDRPFVETKTYAGPCRRTKPSAGKAIPRRRLSDRKELMAALREQFVRQSESFLAAVGGAVARTRVDAAAITAENRDAVFSAARSLQLTVEDMDDDPLMGAVRGLCEGVSGPGVFTPKTAEMAAEFTKALMHLYMVPLEMDRERHLLSEHLAALGGRIAALRRKSMAQIAA